MASSAVLSDRDAGGIPFRLRLVGLACASLMLLAALPDRCLAHGGPPLRLGVTTDSVVSAVARLVLVHLREGVGFAVDWREFPDEAALHAAFVDGRIDLAVGLAEAERLSPPPAGLVCSPETLALLEEGLRRRWGAEVFLLGFAAGANVCVRPALVVARAVLEDLRFGIIGKEIARVAALITREDVAAVQAAAKRGGERAATADARAALAAKAGR